MTTQSSSRIARRRAVGLRESSQPIQGGPVEGMHSAVQRRTRQRIAGISLIGLAVLMLVSHKLEHLDLPTFLPLASPGTQNIVASYPLAVLSIVVGVVLLRLSHEPPSISSDPA